MKEKIGIPKGLVEHHTGRQSEEKKEKIAAATIMMILVHLCLSFKNKEKFEKLFIDHALRFSFLHISLSL